MTHDFTALYDLHHAAISRYCVRKCNDREIGQDMMQETFLRLWICLQRNDQILQARPFIYRIAHNLVIDNVRRKKEISLDGLQEVGFEPSIDPWHHTYSRLDARRPLKMLSTLKKPIRQVLHRRFILGHSPVEIAEHTGNNTNTVSVRIYRGLKQLRVMLDEPKV